MPRLWSFRDLFSARDATAATPDPADTTPTKDAVLASSSRLSHARNLTTLLPGYSHIVHAYSDRWRTLLLFRRTIEDANPHHCSRDGAAVSFHSNPPCPVPASLANPNFAYHQHPAAWPVMLFSLLPLSTSAFSSLAAFLTVKLDFIKKPITSIAFKLKTRVFRRKLGSSSPARDNMISSMDTVTRLSVWDQSSMRSYIRVVLCFPFDNTSTKAAYDHLAASLKRLARQRPDFAGRLEQGEDGIVYLRTSTSPGKYHIPFSITDIPDAFPFRSYSDLKAAHFPPGAFVDPQFAQPCDMSEGKPLVPAAMIKAFFIPGGLLLGVYLSHTLADGACLKVFLDAFAGQTRGEIVHGASNLELSIPKAITAGHSSGARPETVADLLERIPEYTVLDKPTGPTVPMLRPGGTPMDQIIKIGKVFVFTQEKIEQLQSTIQTGHRQMVGATETAAGQNGHNGHQNGEGTETANGNGPATVSGLWSKYICLAALTWAHLSRARMTDSAKYLPDCPSLDKTALLQTMVNWKSRVFSQANKDYFGNATAVAVTRVPTNGLLMEAASNMARLAELAGTIQATIDCIGDDYIRDRTEFFSRVSDPRYIGLNFDPRTPQDLGFNTWRHFGADTKWCIPGTGALPAAPDVIRRLQDVWNMSGALILPAKEESNIYELLVTLPESSMEILCNDPDWMCWVDRVIG